MSESESPDPCRAPVEVRAAFLPGAGVPAASGGNRCGGRGDGTAGASAAGPTRRIARFGRNLVVVFGASEYVAPIRLRLFHIEGRRFSGVAYRIALNPDGSTTWTPDAFRGADLLEAAEHIPSLRIVDAGCPTTLEVGAEDLAMLAARAKPPRRSAGPWPRRGVRLPLPPPTVEVA